MNNESVIVATQDFVQVVQEFCFYLFIIMMAWFAAHAVAHVFKVISFRRYIKSFYRGLSDIKDKTFFIRYIEGGFSEQSRVGHVPVSDLLVELLGIIQSFKRNRNKPSYQGELEQLRGFTRDRFSRNNLRVFFIQFTSASFIFIVLLLHMLFGDDSFLPDLMQPWTVGLYILLVAALYFSREKQGERASKEVAELEKVYMKYLI